MEKSSKVLLLLLVLLLKAPEFFSMSVVLLKLDLLLVEKLSNAEREFLRAETPSVPVLAGRELDSEDGSFLCVIILYKRSLESLSILSALSSFSVRYDMK